MLLLLAVVLLGVVITSGASILVILAIEGHLTSHRKRLRRAKQTPPPGHAALSGPS